MAGYDFAIYLTPLQDLKENIYLWRDRFVTGVDNTYHLPFILYFFIFAFPIWLGASLYTAEKIVFVLFFTLPGLSMYHMVRGLFFNEENVRIASLVSAIFYMFNFLVMAHFGRGNLLALLGYGLLPLFISLLFKGMTSLLGLRYLLLSGILSLGFAFLIGHPPDFFVPLIAIFIFIIFFLYINPDKNYRYQALRFIILAGLFSLSLNLWWIIPLIRYAFNFSLGPDYHRYLYTLTTVKAYSVNLWEIIRSLGNPLYFDRAAGTTFWSAEKYYYHPGFIALGLSFPIIAYASLLFKQKNKYIFYFAFLSILGLFLSKGAAAPWGGIYNYLYSRIPGFFIFRAPYRVFTSLYIFAWAPMIGMGITKILGFFKHKKSANLLLIVFFAFVFIYSGPLFTGSHIQEKGSKVIGGLFFNIPQYYQQANHWLNSNQDNFRVYVPLEIYDVVTDWGYHGVNPVLVLLYKPQLSARPEAIYWEGYQYFVKFINSHLKDSKLGDLSKILGLANVKYILLQNDLHPWSFPYPNFNQRLSSCLNLQKNIDFAKRIGELDFYENYSFLPLIFSSAQAQLVEGGLDSLLPLSWTDYMIKPCIFLKGDLTPREIKSLLPKTETVISIDGSNTQSRIVNQEFIKIIGPGLSNINIGLPKNNNYGVWLLRLGRFAPERRIVSIEEETVDLNRFSYLSFKYIPQLDLTELLIEVDIDTKADGRPDKKIYQRVMLQDKQVNEIDILQSAKEQLGPQDYFYVKDLEIKPIQKDRDLVYQDIFFSGKVGFKRIEQGRDPFSIKIGRREFDIDIEEEGQWYQIARLDLNKADQTFSFTPRNCNYLLRIKPLSPKAISPQPQISFRKVNPTKYLIDVEATHPYFLIFSQSYHPGWQAYIGKKKIAGHYKVNGFANAYYIDKLGNYSITLEFIPQRLFIFGLYLSFILATILIFIFVKLKAQDAKD